ncbi:eppin-like [Gigantopelta aegis]|uniref:eppin-like n=1 Tax=Gigantopelta aegis TaxID=1735272 RepID=UPI001B88E31A|nr:eppin-like [Gigantopelta aegis]
MDMSSTLTSAFVVFIMAITWLSTTSAVQVDSAPPPPPPPPGESGPCAYYCQFGLLPGMCNCDLVNELSVARETPCMLKHCRTHEQCVELHGNPVCVVAGSKPPYTDTYNSGATPEICQQPKVIGRCRAFFRRFYFNTRTGICERFIYGGCGGNTNNFKTLAECRTACIEPKPDNQFIVDFETVYRFPGI